MLAKALLPVSLALLLLGLAEGWVRHIDAPGGVVSRQNGGVPLKDVSLEAAVRELPQLLRAKRQSTSPFPPVIHGDHQFNDGFRRASIHYSGDNSKVIFVLTYNVDGNNNPTSTNLYRSADYGATFTQIDSQLDGSSDSPDADPLLWPNYYVNPSNKNILVFPHATLGKFFFTQDEGVNWQVRTFSPATINPRSLLWNPRNPDWALAHDTQNDHLYVTLNVGVTFTKIADYVHVVDYQWTDADSEPDQDTSVVYYNTYDPNDQNRGDLTEALYTQRNPYGDANRQEFDPSLGKHDDFLLVGPYIFAQKTINDQITLLISYNRQPFQVAKIPSTVPHVNYLVTHIDRLQALVIVEHANDRYNLYLSDLQGAFFSLSLPDIVVEGGRGVDLELIEGINGTMIANQNLRTDATTSTRTLRTLDNGGVWELVSPPDRDLSGLPLTCSPPECSLHFHMTTSEYARLGVYSQDSAPGIIVAHGNTGQSLADSPDLYISRDGGVTWDQTLAGSWGVTVADHGGLLVAADDYHQEPSRVLKYSCNEGATWEDFQFSPDDMVIYGLITEPGEHTTIVSLYGIKSRSSPIRWDVVTVNFTVVFSYTCQSADYYDWEPWDDRTEQDCILGAEVVIERRRPERCCLNGRDYDRIISVNPCACTEDDFDCDYGYMRADGFTGPCVRDPAIQLDDPCVRVNTSYMRSSGYRKIPGDVCIGGVSADFDPYLYSCCDSPDFPFSSSSPPSPTGTGGGGGSYAATVALGVLFAVTAPVALVLAIGMAVCLWKRASGRRGDYQPAVMSSGGRFQFRSTSPDQTVPLTNPTDDDDAPIMP